MRELLWTADEYDLVTVVGSVRSNTMRAISADQMTTIIGKTD